jgi:P27 family predicted phage terminase small subunit
MGRPPKPTELKRLAGTLRKHRANGDEPKPEIGIPEPPADLGERALAEWNYHAPILASLGVLAYVDRNTLACYCVAAGRRAEAEENLRQSGPVVKSPAGHPVQNPWLWVSNKAMEQMQKFGQELGLSPASRTRIKTNKPAAVTGRARFFKKVG